MPSRQNRSLRRTTLALCTALTALATPALVTAAPADESSLSSLSSHNSSSQLSSQDGDFDFGAWAKSVFFDLMQALFNTPLSSKDSFASSVAVTDALGSSEVPFSTVYQDTDDYFPFPIDETVTEAVIVDKRTEGDRLERWTVTSPAMKRTIEVQVLLPEDPTTPAPMLYMLDGLSAGPTSGWLRRGEIRETLAGENVIVVMPTRAGGTNYTDWQQVDEKLGLQKWETFLSEELPGIMESDAAGLNFNGKRAIGGLSMGAGGAVRNAALYPEMWDAAFGISGCYSTTDPTSKTLLRMVTEPRGGDVENMWGEYGSEEWQRHDIAANPEGLRDVRLYLSASDGNITPIDRIPAERDLPFYELPLWAAVEQGMRYCTEQLDTALQEMGHDNFQTRLTEGRVHTWELYADELAPAWEYIKPALY